MNPEFLLYLFIALRVAQQVLENALSTLNYRYYNNPAEQAKAQRILGLSDADLQKSIAYANDRMRFGRFSATVQLTVFIGFLLFGGFGFIEREALTMASSWFSAPSMIHIGLLFFGLLGLLSSVLGIPFDYYATFVIEARYGFNQSTLGRFLADKAKTLVLSALLGGLMLACLLWVMQTVGELWWIAAWGVVVGLSLLTAWLYPSVLAPLFNKFQPLESGELQDKIGRLAKEVGFHNGGIYVMNASIRSSHGNAYFTGVFGKKRIVLFDTLIQAMSADEVTAVLAHELGHFKLHHVRWALVRGFLLTGAMFYFLSLCLPLEVFYHAFRLSGPSTYGALFVFSLWYGLVGFLLQPVTTYLSRRNEFAADAFAKRHLAGDPKLLGTALLKLREKSSSLPIYHPYYSTFYHSHPPMIERLTALGMIGATEVH